MARRHSQSRTFITPFIPLIGYQAVVSIEPEPENRPAPFTLKPLVDSNIEDVWTGRPPAHGQHREHVPDRNCDPLTHAGPLGRPSFSAVARRHPPFGCPDVGVLRKKSLQRSLRGLDLPCSAATCRSDRRRHRRLRNVERLARATVFEYPVLNRPGFPGNSNS